MLILKDHPLSLTIKKRKYRIKIKGEREWRDGERGTQFLLKDISRHKHAVIHREKHEGSVRNKTKHKSCGNQRITFLNEEKRTLLLDLPLSHLYDTLLCWTCHDALFRMLLFTKLSQVYDSFSGKKNLNSISLNFNVMLTVSN